MYSVPDLLISYGNHKIPLPAVNSKGVELFVLMLKFFKAISRNVETKVMLENWNLFFISSCWPLMRSHEIGFCYKTNMYGLPFSF